MAVYPQLSSGALSQFPMLRRRRTRTICNAAADGSWVKLGDPGAASMEWQLEYCGLSDTEIGALQQFFRAAEGSLNGFTFLDPGANLLAWSEVLNNSSWSASPFLTLEGGIADALGGTNGWHLSNAGSGPQRLTQTLQAPGDYTYCFSAYTRSEQAANVTLTAANRSTSFPIGPSWTRISLVGPGDENGTSVVFGIAVPAGAAIDVFGPQAEAQPAPSQYRTATTGGVYPNARFKKDTFSFTTQGVNRHSATVNIFYAKHL
jgi:hypothetical protein